MSKHTPGPWYVDIDKSTAIWSYSIRSPIREQIATVNKYRVSGRWPDARLIAAAPDLLAACRSMLNTTGGSENWNGETHESLKLIEAAIAKATGVDQ